ncbi:hypothetical protein FRB99_003806 [Tulasnella sp. 403]|nr:hypothetical protein FRB99_003806 [Tulasnella sp. 403]
MLSPERVTEDPSPLESWQRPTAQTPSTTPRTPLRTIMGDITEQFVPPSLSPLIPCITPGVPPEELYQHPSDIFYDAQSSISFYFGSIRSLHDRAGSRTSGMPRLLELIEFVEHQMDVVLFQLKEREEGLNPIEIQGSEFGPLVDDSYDWTLETDNSLPNRTLVDDEDEDPFTITPPSKMNVLGSSKSNKRGRNSDVKDISTQKGKGPFMPSTPRSSPLKRAFALSMLPPVVLGGPGRTPLKTPPMPKRRRIIAPEPSPLSEKGATTRDTPATMLGT